VKPIEDADEHTVAHDAVSIGVAGALGLLAGAVTESPAMGVATAGVVVVVGIGGMAVGPIRRTVNRAVLAFAPSEPEQAEEQAK
jgi:hypothetical protein